MFALLLLTAMQPGQVEWAPSVQVAKSYAVRTKKPVMVVGTWNPNILLTMDRCFRDKRVGAASRNFICVKSSLEALPALTRFDARKLPIPVFFVAPSGEIVARLGGFIWPRDVAEFLNLTSWAFDTRTSSSRSGTSPKGLLDMSLREALKGELARAESLLRRAEAGKAPRESLAYAYLTIADQYRAEAPFTNDARQNSIPLSKALSHLNRSLELSVGPRQTFRARARLTSTYLRLRDIPRAEASLAKCMEIEGLEAEDREAIDVQFKRLELMKANKR